MPQFVVYNKETAHQEIAQLVERFNADQYHVRQAKEADIEKNFIRPFFRALNWDVYEQSRREPEFLAQYHTRKGKRPDYLLKPQDQHLLFVEAKQVKIDIKKRYDYQWQAYQYAYGTQKNSLARKVDFAILTDFEEFMVLDCTFLVNRPEAVSQLEVFYWTCDQYLEKFDLIWNLFERDNILRAASTRDRPPEERTGLWKHQLTPTQAKAKRIPPDEAFLEKLNDKDNGWRIQLARDMKKIDPTLNGHTITAAVQLIINRLLFVKAISDRELEDDLLNNLSTLIAQDDTETGWFAACQDLFKKLDRFYNGSIFEPRPELEAVQVKNKTIKKIVDELRPENSPYNFATMPVEILGTVYERFLGYVVKVTSKRVSIEEKPEVKKAGGVYYTPQYIVEYIINHTVQELLDQCKTPEDVVKLKILDPACGSGSFLLSAYEALMKWYQTYYTKKSQWTKQDQEYVRLIGERKAVRLTAKLKRTILLNNIFGVDIDEQACEVTKFSLSLKALENSSKEELNYERGLFKETIVPDLSRNIKCGNSLVEEDWFEQKSLSVDDEVKDRREIKPFSWDKAFPLVCLQGGFDAVIGNPPWGAEFTDETLKYCRSRYSEIIKRMIDSFMYFTYKSVSLARISGTLGLIVPDVLLYQIDNVSLRRFLLKTCSLSSIVNMGNVFKGVARPCCVVTMVKERVKADYDIPVQNLSGKLHIPKQDALGKNMQYINASTIETIPNSLFITEKTHAYNLLKKILKDSPHSLTDFVDGDGIQRGVSPDLKEAFLVNSSTGRMHQLESAFLKPVVTGGIHVKRYRITTPDLLIIYTTSHTDWNAIPNICKYIDLFREKISCKEVVQEKHSVYRLHRPREYSIFEKAIKLVGVITSDKLIVTLDDSGIYCTDGLYLFGLNGTIDAHVLLGILNSRLLRFIYKLISMEEGRVHAQVKPSTICALPMCTHFTDLKAEKYFASKVQDLTTVLIKKDSSHLESEQNLFAAMVEKLDREIDQIVYNLYGLADDEIATVETVTK